MSLAGTSAQQILHHSSRTMPVLSQATFARGCKPLLLEKVAVLSVCGGKSIPIPALISIGLVDTFACVFHAVNGVACPHVLP